MTNYHVTLKNHVHHQPQVKLQCNLSWKFGLWSLFLFYIWLAVGGEVVLGAVHSLLDFAGGSTLLSEKWGLNRPAGKAELALNWCGYTAGSTWRASHNARNISTDGSLMGQLMWLLINVWSKLHHVLLMRLPFSLGACFPEIGKISQAHTRAMNREHITQSRHAID